MLTNINSCTILYGDVSNRVCVSFSDKLTQVHFPRFYKMENDKAIYKSCIFEITPMLPRKRRKWYVWNIIFTTFADTRVECIFQVVKFGSFEIPISRIRRLARVFDFSQRGQFCVFFFQRRADVKLGREKCSNFLERCLSFASNFTRDS